jgi:hypothetical protein
MARFEPASTRLSSCYGLGTQHNAERKSDLHVFPGMKMREANLNIMVLAGVLLFSLVISGVAALFERRTSPADRKLVYAAEPVPVRVVGPAFVPNTNPRERQ